MFQSFDGLTVDFVDKPTAREMIVNNHYSKKWNATFGKENIGVFRDGRLLGVAAYGYPMNPKSWGSITSLEPSQCIELNRLWIDDELGKNSETWLLSQSFDLLRAKGFRLVQSFADGRLGVGTIYQAANFTYHGYHSTLFHRDKTTGDVLHDVPFSDTSSLGMVSRNVLHANNRLESFKVNTYRYLKPLDKGARRTIKLSSLPYPKERFGEQAVIGYTPPAGQIARAAALAEAAGDWQSYATLTTMLNNICPNGNELMDAQRGNRWVTKLREQREPKHPTLFDLVGA